MMTMSPLPSDLVLEGPVAHRRSQREAPPGPSSEPSPRTSSPEHRGLRPRGDPAGPGRRGHDHRCGDHRGAARLQPLVLARSRRRDHTGALVLLPRPACRDPVPGGRPARGHRHPDVGVRLFPDPGLPGCSQRPRCPGHDPDPDRLGAHRRRYRLVGRRACLRGPSGAGTEGLPPPHHAGRGLRRLHGIRCRDGPLWPTLILLTVGLLLTPLLARRAARVGGWPHAPTGSTIAPMWILRMR